MKCILLLLVNISSETVVISLCKVKLINLVSNAQMHLNSACIVRLLMLDMIQIKIGNLKGI